MAYYFVSAMHSYKIGEIIKVNKWSPSFYPFECYDPENGVFPKQRMLFGDYSFIGVILELNAEMCYVWVMDLERCYYLYYKDVEKCQD
jgi:hypothetical protein